MATQLEAAQERYPKASTATKKVLEEIFGKEQFIPKIQNTIDSFEKAYPVFKKMKTKDPFWLLLQKRKVTELSVIEQLMIIAEVLRNGWEADYGNSNQQKWFPIHVQKGSGFVFSSTAYDFTHTYTGCGARLALPTDELANHFGSHKNFLPLWNQLLTIKK